MSGLSDILEKCLREVQNPTKAAPPKPVKILHSGLPSRSLYFQEGSSDKEYNIQVVHEEPGDYGYIVKFQYGRRGKTLIEGTKTNSPVGLDEARSIFRKVVFEKTKKGYR